MTRFSAVRERSVSVRFGFGYYPKNTISSDRYCAVIVGVEYSDFKYVLGVDLVEVLITFAD